MDTCPWMTTLRWTNSAGDTFVSLSSKRLQVAALWNFSNLCSPVNWCCSFAFLFRRPLIEMWGACFCHFWEALSRSVFSDPLTLESSFDFLGNFARVFSFSSSWQEWTRFIWATKENASNSGENNLQISHHEPKLSVITRVEHCSKIMQVIYLVHSKYLINIGHCIAVI